MKFTIHIQTDWGGLTSLDKEILDNYRPVSNLPFTSKLIEWVVCKQLISHLNNNSLPKKYQSAYMQYYSTETALTAVVNHLLTSLDQKRAVFLVLLDLSVAFDTIDHAMLLNLLNNRTALRDTAYNWVESYLSDRHQYVSVASSNFSRKNCFGGSLRDRSWDQCCFLFTLSTLMT